MENGAYKAGNAGRAGAGLVTILVFCGIVLGVVLLIYFHAWPFR